MVVVTDSQKWTELNPGKFGFYNIQEGALYIYVPSPVVSDQRITKALIQALDPEQSVNHYGDTCS